MNTKEQSEHQQRITIFWFLAAICCLTLLPFLGLSDYNTKGEPREAVVAMSMLESGNWILPLNNGGEIPYKPPFFHWLVAACSLLTGGHVTEYASRLPSALALIGLTLGTFVFFARRRGNRLGLITALVAFTTLELHRAGMNTRVDMVLTALTVGAIMLLFRWNECGMRGIPWLAILLMSFATLTKGPVGIILPCLVAGIYMLMRRRNFFRAFLTLAAWGVMALVIPLLWYWAAYQQGGEEFLDLVMEENFGRMTNTMAYDSCVNPWPYNILTLITGFIPWTIAALMALAIAPWKRLCNYPWKEWKQRFAVWYHNVAPDRMLAFVAVAVIFLFYCFPQSKRSVYLMPLYPFLALFVAEMVEWMESKHKGWLKAFGDIIAGIAVLMTLVFIVAKCGLIPDSAVYHGRHGAEKVAQLHGIMDIGGFIGWFSVLIAPAVSIIWWSVWRRKKEYGQLAATIALMICGVYMSLAGAYQPAILNTRSAKPVAAEVDAAIPASQGTLYEFIGYATFAAGDPMHYFELNFYMGDRIRNFVKDHPNTGFLIMSDWDAENYMSQFEANGYRLEPVMATSRPMMKEPTHIYRFIRNGHKGPLKLEEVK